MPDEAVERILVAAKRANKPVCVMVGSQPEAQDFANLGATAFIIWRRHKLWPTSRR